MLESSSTSKSELKTMGCRSGCYEQRGDADFHLQAAVFAPHFQKHRLLRVALRNISFASFKAELIRAFKQTLVGEDVTFLLTAFNTVVRPFWQILSAQSLMFLL